MAEQKQDSRRSKGSGESKKKGGQQAAPMAPRMGEAAKAAAVRKHRLNAERHLAQQERRAKKAKEAATPRGTARLERRRLARLADVERAGLARRLEFEAIDAATEVVEPVADCYAPTPLGHQLAAMNRSQPKTDGGARPRSNAGAKIFSIHF